MDEEQFENYPMEEKILSFLNNPNIVKVHNVHESREYTFIVMEIIEGGSLKSFIENRIKAHNPISDDECSQIIKQILLGLDTIHNHHIIHRDINPNNILFRSSDINDGLVIIDFGLAIRLEATKTNRKCGTILYMAPEQINGEEYNTVIRILNIGSRYMGHRHSDVLYVILESSISQTRRFKR